MITLGSIQLPSGLAWSDEFTWSPVVQSSEYSLTGALIVQTAVKLAGRPITLIGQSSGNDHTAWMPRSDVMALQAALATPGATFTLTLHDGRTFLVMPAADVPLEVTPLAVYGSFTPATPGAGHLYVMNSLKLQTV